MLTLLGSLLGFISSAFPDLLKIWQDKQDRKHELEILDRQMEQMRLDHSQRLEKSRSMLISMKVWRCSNMIVSLLV